MMLPASLEQSSSEQRRFPCLSRSIVRLSATALLVTAGCFVRAQAPSDLNSQTPPAQETAPAQTSQPDTTPQRNAQPTNTAAVAVLRGVVKSGNMPIPGVTVTAINTATHQKTSTWTDVDGSYILPLPAAGTYFLRTQMTGFAPAMQRLQVTASQQQRVDLELVLASRYQGPMPGERPNGSPGTNGRQANANGNTGRAGGMGNGRFQSLNVMQGEEAGNFQNSVAPPGMPVPGIAPNTSTESVEVSGNNEGGLSGASSEEMRQRWQDARDQREGPGGPSTPGGYRAGPGGGPPGGGGPIMVMRAGGRGFDINRPHGTVYYTLG